MPDSTPFPFLNLPTLVQLLIVKCLDVSHFLLFSLMSRRAKGIAKQLKLDIDIFQWDLNDENKTYQLKLRAGNFTMSIFNAKREAEANLSRFVGPSVILHAETIISSDNILQLNVNKTPISIIRPTNSGEFWRIQEENLGSEDVLELLEHLSKHFLSIATVTDFSFNSFNLRDPENFWGFQLVEKWEQVDISGCDSFFLTAKSLKFYVKELKTIGMCLRSKVENGFKWTKDCGVMKTENLTIHDSKWMTLDALLAMECKKLRMTCAQFSDSDLNTFIKHWLSGGLRNLVYIDVTFECRSNEERLDNILEGIDTFQSEQRPVFRGYSARNVGDIRRSDELFATAALLYRSYRSRTFRFYVWPSQNVDCF